MRIVFAGTPEFAACHLKALLERSADCDYEIIAAYTQPDRASGRGRKLISTPVKQVATNYNVPVFQPKTLKTEAVQADLRTLKPDLMVVVAYGLLLPQEVLDIPVKGCINVHGSILPRWRGAAPIQRAIEAGDKVTGITIMQMDAGLDTGNMLHKVGCDIYSDDTSSILHDRLMQMGPSALLSTIKAIQAQCLQPELQQEALATYAHKLSKEESCIYWEQSAETIALKIRAFNPWPVAWTQLADERVRILFSTPVKELLEKSEVPGTILCHEYQGKKGLYVQCHPGVLRLDVLQLAGKKSVKAHDLLNSRREIFKQGLRFSVVNA